MRLREALIFALRYEARLAKRDRADTLEIRDGRFYGSEFRAKYGTQPEIRLTAADCLADDWYLMKNGREFVPDDWRSG